MPDEIRNPMWPSKRGSASWMIWTNHAFKSINHANHFDPPGAKMGPHGVDPMPWGTVGLWCWNAPNFFFSWDLPILWFNPADIGWHSKPCESSWPQVGDACARAWWQDAAEQQAQHSRMSEGCRVLSNLIVSLDHILTMMLGKCLKMRAILAGTRTSCDGWKVFALVKKQCRVAWPVYFANAHHTCGCSEFSMSGICVGDSNCRECLVEWKFRHAAQRTVIACGLVSYYNDDERS